MKKRMLAVLLAVVTLLSCSCGEQGEKAAVNMDEEVTICWYLPGGNHPDAQKVFEEANKTFKEKLNTTVDFRVLEFGAYEQKLQIINAGRGEYDIGFTSNWMNNYYTNVEKGSFLDITDMLPEYAPNLYESILPKYWDGIKIDGRIYAAINQQIMARGSGFMFPTSLVEKYNIDTESINSLADFEPYLRQIVKDDPNCNQVNNFWVVNSLYGLFGMESVLGDETPPAVFVNTDSDKLEIVNQYTTQEYKDYIALRSRWNKEGLTKASLLTPSEKGSSAFRGGTLYSPILLLSTYKPGVVEEESRQHNVDLKIKVVGEPLLNTYGVTATLNAIADTSPNPERALMVLDLVNTDKKLYNTIAYGLEGVHYTKTGENKIKLAENNSYTLAPWVIGNNFNSYFMDNQSETIWDETLKLNDEATVSPLYGFVPDTGKISVQIANCKSVVGEYQSALGEGVGDTEKLYNEFISKLEAAGVNELIAELQAQLDAWSAK